MALKTLNKRNKKDLKWPKIIIALLSTIGGKAKMQFLTPPAFGRSHLPNLGWVCDAPRPLLLLLWDPSVILLLL